MRLLPSCLALLVACSPSASTSTGSVPASAEPAPTTIESGAPSSLTSSPAAGNGGLCWAAEPGPGTDDISWLDRTADLGLIEPLTGMHGHAGGWGQLDGDGVADLVVGTFANRPIERYQVRGADGPRPDALLQGGASFASLDVDLPFGRTSGVAVVDLDNDGDDDVVLSRNMRARERADAPSQILRNDGTSWAVVDLDLGRMFSGRSVGVLDFNQDGLLDLLILEDRFGGEQSTVLLENLGDLAFRDATAEAGIPAGVHGLGVAVSDVTGDGRADFFVGGANRLFVATDSGFVEAPGSEFVWETYGAEDDVAGVSIADVNRDDLPDLLVGHHFNSTLAGGDPVPVRLYLHRGVDGEGMPLFEDVTEHAGLVGLPTKAPHVEVADLDNDGWPDLLTSASADEGAAPAVFRSLGIGDEGIPTFAPPVGLGDAQYWVSGPTADVDRDGRLDVLLVEWEPVLPSLVLLNNTASGNWLQVALDGSRSLGAVVRVWMPGGIDEPGELLGRREIIATEGYASSYLPVAHFGLGDVTAVDISVEFPDGSRQSTEGVAANQHVNLTGGCG